MTQKARTEYGARLFTARKHAKLTQTALAKAVEMSQSAYAEAESTGHSSTFTAQLAAACRVNPNWLATGDGSMLADTEAARPEADQVAHALEVLTKTLQRADEDVRLSLEPLLASMAREPAKAVKKSQLILRLLFTDTVQTIPAENDRPTHIFGEVERLDLGGHEHGRGDRDAAQGGGRKS